MPEIERAVRLRLQYGNLRMIRNMPIIMMRLHRAKPTGQCAELRRRDVLISEENHLTIQECTMDFVEHRVQQRPAEVDTIDLGPKGSGHGRHGHVPIADFRAAETLDGGILCHAIVLHFQYAGKTELSVGSRINQN